MKTLFQLSEAVEKHHVTAFTRMNPPTTGHMQLIDKVHSVAKENSADHSVVVSHSQDPKKNPLSSDQKKKHLKRFSPETNVVASSKEHPTILHHLSALHKAGVTHAHIVAGSDRHDEMSKLTNAYNGKKAGHGYYKFKKITIHSAGERDPDAEGTSGISATKQREHAASGNFKEFRKGVPSHVSDAHAKDLMNDVKNGQKTKKNEESEMESLDNLFEQFMIEDSQSFSDEEIWNVVSGMHSHELDPNENDVEFVDILMGESYEEDIDESRVLSIAQRQRAKMKFKSRQPRLKRMREIKRKRMATPQRLQYRARTSALMMLRKRIAGAKGLAYHTLSPSQRYTIDKAVQQRFGKNLDKLVGTISKRTLPMIRKKEMARLAKARGQKTSSIIGPQTMTQSYDVSEAPDYISTNNDHLLTPKVNMLLRLGLVDQDEIERYRRALKIGEKALSSPELRGKILSMLDKILKLATDDPQTFARIRAMVVLKKNSQNEQNSLEVNPLEIDPLKIDKMDPTPDEDHSNHLNLRKKMVRQHEAVNPAIAAQKAQKAQKASALRQQKIQRSLKQKAFTEKQRREKEQFNASTGKPQKKFSSMRTKTSTKSSGVSALGGIASAVTFGGERALGASIGNALYRGYKKLTSEYDPLAEDKIVESLYKKSMKYNISIDTVVEVYEDALKDSGNENFAFDAVNSFLANLELDEVQRSADVNRVKVRLPDGRTVWRNDRRETGVQNEEVELNETNHREFASQGKMHPDMAKHMSVGQEHDYYEHGTGDKVSGKVMHKSATEVHMKQTHDSYDPKKKGTVHKFKISDKLDEARLFASYDEAENAASPDSEPERNKAAAGLRKDRRRAYTGDQHYDVRREEHNIGDNVKVHLGGKWHDAVVTNGAHKSSGHIEAKFKYGAKTIKTRFNPETEVKKLEEEADADSIFEIEMYVPEIHEARGDHLLTIEGGRGKGRKFSHKDTSTDDHLSAMEFHLKGYHAAKKDKLDATKNHHAKMYHKHKDQIEALGEKGNHLKESNAHKILAQKIQQMANRKKMTDDALARHNAEQEKKGVSKDAETKFHTKLDSLVHDTFGKRKSEKRVAEGRVATDAEHKKTLDTLFTRPDVVNMSRSLKKRDQDAEYDAKKKKEFKDRLKGVSEEGGAGEFGTSELTKKYAKDTPGQCQEILNMNTADMGDVIKDFKKSDAPQFKGKSVEKRRQMAIAAKLSSQDKE